MSLIEKIDNLLNSEYSHGDIQTSLVRDGLLIARDIILSEQKEPDVTDTNVGKILTIGDKIRESNESLADFIIEIQNDVTNGQIWGTVQGCENYLNQPYTES
jgi:hypothetical protein